jgi:threonine dehydratase
MVARQYSGMQARFRPAGPAHSPGSRAPGSPGSETATGAARPTGMLDRGAGSPPSSQDPEPLPLVTLDAIRDAAGVLRGVVVRTPLLPFGAPLPGDARGGTRAWLKPESLQPIGAFKLRGAYYSVAMLSAEARAAGVVAHSSGNHAQGVARAARLLGVRAVIVMPSDAPAVKVARVRADGAEIVVVGPASEERAERAADLVRTDGLTLVAPYDDAATITGQGTVGLEIVEQVAELDRAGDRERAVTGAGRRGHLGVGYGGHRRTRESATLAAPMPLTVLVPVGGGGLASGVATAVKTLRPDATVIGVEPELGADAQESLRVGHIVTWPAETVGSTIADGQRTAHIGPRTFAHMSRYLDAIITVSEDEIRRAMVRAAREARLVLEPSGATSLAALLFRSASLPDGGRIVAVLSGGNVDPARYATLIAEGEAAGG